jgi:hypothetical protein
MLVRSPTELYSALQANGADIKGGTWFETGAEMLNGGTLNYFAVPFGIVNNPLPLVAITLVEVVLIGAVENYRCAARCSLLPDCHHRFCVCHHSFCGPLRTPVCSLLVGRQH